MFKAIIKGSGFNVILTDLDQVTAFKLIELAMKAKFPEAMPAKVATAVQAEPEPQPVPAGEPP